MRIADERAEEMNGEIGKAMFQVAVSSVMSRGTLTAEQSAELSRLKSRFAAVLPADVADTIVSEVGVMRVLHELQKLLHEQDVTPAVRRISRTITSIIRHTLTPNHTSITLLWPSKIETRGIERYE